MQIQGSYWSSCGRTTSAFWHSWSFLRPCWGLWSLVIRVTDNFCFFLTVVSVWNISLREFMKLNSWMVNVFVKDFFFYFFISDSTAFSSSNPHAFQINFNSLYTALCEQQKSDQATLLLYMLLHQNGNVRTYVLARTDIENLVSIALLVLHSSQRGDPGSLAVTSCQCSLFCGGSSRFWLTYSPVLAHLLIFIMSS